jgi:hypothetical protein
MEAGMLSKNTNSSLNRANIDGGEREGLCTGNEGDRPDPMLVGGVVAGLRGSSMIEGVATGGGVQVEGRTSDVTIFDAPFVADIA